MDKQTIEATVWQHLEQLSVKIGPRPAGSAANQAAADYIRAVFERHGLVIETQPFACPCWEAVTTLQGPGGQQWPAAANAFSPPCDVTAPVVALGTAAELEAVDLTGRIALLYGALSKQTWSPKDWFLIGPEEQQLIQQVEEKRPAALITVNPRPGSMERIIEDWAFTIPSATVAAETGLALRRLGEGPLTLQIESHRSPSQAANLVGIRPGERPERIVLCAHFDTKLDTPGAFDNGGGAAALLTLVRLLAAEPLPVSLEFVAFGGEDSGAGLDDQTYISRRGDRLGEILLAINMDGIGQWLGANSIMAVAGSPALDEMVAAVARQYPGVVPVEPWVESNHSTFSFRGVPAVALSSAGGANVIHQPADTIEWMSPAKLAEVVLLVANLVQQLQEQTIAWTRNSSESVSS